MRNPALYNAMKAVFKETPKIINEDDPAIFLPPPPVMSIVPVTTTLKSKEIAGGEQYVVNCPYCGDRRQRLYISHMWDTVIKYNGIYYRAPTTLLRCFNEDCQRDKNFKFQLVKDLRQQMKNPAPCELNPYEADAHFDSQEVSNLVELPERRMPLNSPSVPGYIHSYLNTRGFTVEQLMSYGVEVAVTDRFHYPFLVIPVRQYGNYWFWQGRLVPLDGTEHGALERDAYGEEYPKYYIAKGSKKSWVLYNSDEAVKYNKVIIVEGVTDVWRIGPCAIAKFGRDMSSVQRKMLQTRFAGREIVIVPDGNDPLANDAAVEDMLALNTAGRFKSVKVAFLPPGKDPGQLTEKQVWHYINLSTSLPG